MYAGFKKDYIDAGFGHCLYCERKSLGNICSVCSGEISRGRNVLKDGKWSYPQQRRIEDTPLKKTHGGFIYV